MRPPKSLTQLRTRENFRSFFRGMPAGRMQRLLLAAYAGRDPEEVPPLVFPSRQVGVEAACDVRRAVSR